MFFVDFSKYFFDSGLRLVFCRLYCHAIIKMNRQWCEDLMRLCIKSFSVSWFQLKLSALYPNIILVLICFRLNPFVLPMYFFAFGRFQSFCKFHITFEL